MPAGRYPDWVKPIAEMPFDAELPSVRWIPFQGRRLSGPGGHPAAPAGTGSLSVC